MAYLATDAVWTAIAERIEGVNTIAPRAMPTQGQDGYLKCDRVEGQGTYEQATRALAQGNASIAIEVERSPQSGPMLSNSLIYLLRIRVRITYNLTSQADNANVYQATKSMAQRHADMLTQALCCPDTLLVTQAQGVSWTGGVLPAGTATGLISGMLYPDSPGMTITRDDGDNSDVYETELAFTATVDVAAATS